MQEHVIHHEHNEASGMLTIENVPLLRQMGWKHAFWIVNDEKPVHKAVAALGLSGAADPAGTVDESAWRVLKLKAKRSKHSSKGETEDCEALARAGSWIYIFGSHYGSKEGPLEPERQFVARFNESLVRVKDDKLKVEMEVARPPFLLHRIINDAIARRNITLYPRSAEVHEAFIEGTQDEVKGKWAERVRQQDYPVNIEGATLLPNGRLLLGLRYPVTQEGHPIVVVIDGIDRIFDGRGMLPEVTGIVTLCNVGNADKPVGVRELDSLGYRVHVVTGDLDSKPEKSKLFEGHPEGEQAISKHFYVDLPRLGGDFEAHEVRSFSDDANVEGIAVSSDGAVWYAHDSEEIFLHYAAPEEEAET